MGAAGIFGAGSLASRWGPDRRWRCCRAENATGNFVKVVQRLPVRIDLIDYNPELSPALYWAVGYALRAYLREADGPNAGKISSDLMPANGPVCGAPGPSMSAATLQECRSPGDRPVRG